MKILHTSFEDKTIKYIKKNIKTYYDIAVSIVKNRDISIEFRNVETAYSDPLKNKIVFGISGCPSNLYNFPEIVNMLVKGYIVHESGHLLLTRPINKRVNNWIREASERYDKKVRRMVFNLLEDIRIETYLKMRYKYDLGKDIEAMNRILALQIKASQDGINYYNKPKCMVEAILNKFIFNLDIEHYIKHFTEEEYEDFKKLCKIAEEIKFKRITLDIMRLVKKFYYILQKNIKDEWGKMSLVEFLNAPNLYGGRLENKPISEEDLKRIKRNLKRIKEKKKQIIRRGFEDIAGKSLGDEIPSPKPDKDNYLRLKNECAEEIEKLKKLLKFKTQVKTTKAYYQKKGRLMNNLISRFYSISMNRKIRRVFIKNQPILTKSNIALAIIVDFSGSVPRHLAEKSLTIIAEAFSDYVADSHLALLVFGKNFQKIKAFSEQWNKTKFRIGNITVNADATTIEPCLFSTQKMFNMINHNTIKVVCLVSDFKFSDQKDKLYKRITSMINYSKIKFFGLKIGINPRKDLDFLIPSEEIRSVTELPTAIAKKYFEILNQKQK